MFGRLDLWTCDLWTFPVPLLIDTYNLLHVTGVMPPELAGNDIPWLFHLLQNSRHKADRITLVCDGAPSSASTAPTLPPRSATRTTTLASPLIEHFDTITIRYAGKGKSADALIEQLVKASTAPRRLLVVSSDLAIIKSARKRKCRTITSEEFLQHLADDFAQHNPPSAPIRKPPGGISEAQVNQWVKTFSLDEKTLALRPGETPPPEPRKNSRETADRSSSQKKSATTRATDSTPPSTAPPADQPPPIKGPVIPKSLIEQAEQLWTAATGKSRSTVAPHPNSGEDTCNAPPAN